VILRPSGRGKENKRSKRKAEVGEKGTRRRKEWYNPPEITPQTGTSDHRAAMIQPTGRGGRCVVKPQVTIVRSRDDNDRALLAHALKNFNWAALTAIVVL